MEDFLKDVEAAVFDLDGTLVEAMPYQELLVKIANITNVLVESLLARYYGVSFNLDEATNYHLSLCISEVQREAVSLVYQEFLDAKQNPTIINGAREVLEAVSRASLCAVCWTRGNIETQKQTLVSADLMDYFDVVVAVSQKSVETVKSELLPVLHGKKFILVGDSFEQDILPALGLAEKLFWVSGSRVNKSGLVKMPDVFPEGIIKTETVAELLPYLQVNQERGD